jgi:hypothetical protein
MRSLRLTPSRPSGERAPVDAQSPVGRRAAVIARRGDRPPAFVSERQPALLAPVTCQGALSSWIFLVVLSAVPQRWRHRCRFGQGSAALPTSVARCRRRSQPRTVPASNWSPRTGRAHPIGSGGTAHRTRACRASEVRPRAGRETRNAGFGAKMAGLDAAPLSGGLHAVRSGPASSRRVGGACVTEGPREECRGALEQCRRDIEHLSPTFAYRFVDTVRLPA